jgi:hypothetical protein
MLIEAILPIYHVREYHEVLILGHPAQVYQAVRWLDFSRSAIIRTLFSLRGIPTPSMRIEDLLRVGFVLVDELPGEEFVLGLIGKFWTSSGKIAKVDGIRYRRFNSGGYAKAAWNFAIHDGAPGRVRLSTETRVLCTDHRSRRRFRIYWLLVGPFSAWIRREFLKTVKARVEGVPPARLTTGGY